MRTAVAASLPKGSHEIIKDRLYFTSFRKSQQRRPNPKCYYLSIDNTLKYQPFFADFGPLNLGLLYRFCCLLSDKLADAEQHDKTVVYYCRASPQNIANGAYLIGAFQIICLHRSAEEAYAPFAKSSFMPFRDASMGHCTYHHTVQHCLEAIEKAKFSKFLDFKTFNLEEYEYYERVECGDFNIIMPGKFLAFSGPNAGPVDADGYAALTPAHYIPIFKKMGVSTIIRLNRRCYDRRKFTAKGFTHYDLIYPDGTIPPARILETFLEICLTAKGIVAVHCKAGLGRTGTLIACYMMRYCGWNARECIAWIRICRPGSVIGPQQYYLLEKEPELMALYRNDAKRKALGAVASEAGDEGAISAAKATRRASRVASSGRLSRSSDGIWRRLAPGTTTPKKTTSTPTDLDFGDDPYHRPSSRHATLMNSAPDPPSADDLAKILLNSRISKEIASTENVPRNYSSSSSSSASRSRTRSGSTNTSKAISGKSSVLSSTNASKSSTSSSSTRIGSVSSTRSAKSPSRSGSLTGDGHSLMSQHRYVIDTSTPSAKVEARLSTGGLRPDQISQGRYLMNAKRGIREKLTTNAITTPTNARSSQRSRSNSSPISSATTTSRPVPIRMSGTGKTLTPNSKEKLSSTTAGRKADVDSSSGENNAIIGGNPRRSKLSGHGSKEPRGSRLFRAGSIRTRQ